MTGRGQARRSRRLKLQQKRALATAGVWQDHVRNTDVSSLKGLGPAVLNPVVCRRSLTLWTRIARLPEDAPSSFIQAPFGGISRGHRSSPLLKSPLTK